jgi:hypothetical protein
MNNIVYNSNTVSAIKGTIGTLDACYASVDIRDDISNRINEIEQKVKEPEVDPAMKTNIVCRDNILYVKHYKDGFFKSERKLLPDIVDVRVYGNTVLVMFADKTNESAVLDSEDEFSLEQGISICITKKLLGEDGHALYNKLIERAFKVIKKNEAAAEAKKKQQKEKQEEHELKKVRAQHRKEKKLEESINAQAEAIKRALVSMIGNKFSGV